LPQSNGFYHINQGLNWLLHLATKRYRCDKNVAKAIRNISPSKQIQHEVKAMNFFNSVRHTDKRDEILICLIAAFIPMVSLGAMIHI